MNKKKIFDTLLVVVEEETKGFSEEQKLYYNKGFVKGLKVLMRFIKEKGGYQ
jgi:hypothetical protein